MTRLIYAARFDVDDRNGMDDVLSTYQDWITETYRRRHQILNLGFDARVGSEATPLPFQHLLTATHYDRDDMRAVRLLWSFPAPADAGLRWSNEVRIGQFGERCAVEHTIAIESTDYIVSPTRIQLGSPRAIRDVCQKKIALIGRMQIKAEPYFLNEAEFPNFLDLLTNEGRKLPMVLLTPSANGKENAIDAKKISLELAGVAIIVAVTDSELTWDIAAEFGRRLSCFDGAARIYWPGFSKDADPKDHRLFLGAMISDLGPEHVARAIEHDIFAVAAFRFTPDLRISKLILESETSERQKNLDAHKRDGDEYWEDYQRVVDELKEASQKISNLEGEISSLKANQKIYFEPASRTTSDVADPSETVTESFSSVSEALIASTKKFTNLEVLDSALSAAKNSPFRRPQDIFQALSDLASAAEDWKGLRVRDGQGGDIFEHIRVHGGGRRVRSRISDTTRGLNGTKYTFNYRGERRLFEPHITLGSGDANSCASIHFIFDNERAVFVVAHVGRHLPNTKT